MHHAVSDTARAYGPEGALAAILALALRQQWARSWCLSGAVFLSYVLIVGELRGKRILSWAPLPLLLILINLAQAAAATSWLFNGVFAAICWPAILISALFTFDWAADATRRGLRSVLQAVHFTADTVAFFDLPGLQIDQDVDGLMAVRGITFSFSTLTLTAHGVEVGIKLSDDLELALQTDKVTVAFFRRIDISDVYCNVKGGMYEQDHGALLTPQDDPGNATADSELMLDTRSSTSTTESMSRDEVGNFELAESDASAGSSVTHDEAGPLSMENSVHSSYKGSHNEKGHGAEYRHLTEKMTDGRAPLDADADALVQSTTRFSVDDGAAKERYRKTLEQLQNSSGISVAHDEVEKRVNGHVPDEDADELSKFDFKRDEHLRAAICSRLHLRPSVQHPPKQSIRVTTLQKALPPRIRKLLHRMPMLLRALLCPLAYFHPVRIHSATASAQGRWVKTILDSEIFRNYVESSSDIRKLRERVFDWLSDANFVMSFQGMTGLAQVPFFTNNMIDCRIYVDEINVYRALPKEIKLRKVVQIGGCDAAFLVPSILLPHHEHLLPTAEDRQQKKEDLKGTLKRSLSQPKVLQAERALEANDRDEVQVKLSTHLHLPACFDQELLNFISTLVKASKIIEFEKSFHEAMSGEVHTFNDFKTLVKTGMREGAKRTAVNAAANDRWIAKMVGKATSRLETLHGDIGYSGDIPVPLKPYREKAEPESKILP